MVDIVEVPSTGEAKDNEDVVVGNVAGGVTLLEANPHRKSALIINTGSAAMRVTTDGTAPTATRGKRVPSGTALELSSPYCPTKEVKAIREGTTDTSANASEVD
jgi:hypothetical protein